MIENEAWWILTNTAWLVALTLLMLFAAKRFNNVSGEGSVEVVLSSASFTCVMTVAGIFYVYAALENVVWTVLLAPVVFVAFGGVAFAVIPPMQGGGWTAARWLTH